MNPVWRRYGFLFLLGLLLQVSAYAEVHAPFYEATRGKQSVYILGTLHVGKPDFYPFRQEIRTALKQSTHLYLELNHDQAAAEQKMAHAMLCARPCLKEALSDNEWKALSARLGNAEAAIQEVGRIKPWAAAVVLAMADYLALGFSPELAVEKHLTDASKGKSVIGLESIDEQIGLFSGMPAAEQKELLVQWINMTPQERLRMSGELIEMWKAGDADALYAWYQRVQAQYSSSPETAEAFDRRFIVERNHVFVERMLSRISKKPGPFFMAVGALHLGGPEGVLALMKKQGFTIKAR